MNDKVAVSAAEDNVGRPFSVRPTSNGRGFEIVMTYKAHKSVIRPCGRGSSCGSLRAVSTQQRRRLCVRRRNLKPNASDKGFRMTGKG